MKRPFIENFAKIWIILFTFYFVFLSLAAFGDLFGNKRELEQAKDLGMFLEIYQEQQTRGGTIAMTIGIIFLVFALGFYILVLLFSKKWGRYSFKCPKCDFVFKPFSLKSASLYLINGPLYFVVYTLYKPRFFLRCPQCKKFSWCSIVEDISESNNKNL